MKPSAPLTRQWLQSGDCKRCYNRDKCGKECAAHADKLRRQVQALLLSQIDRHNDIFTEDLANGGRSVD